MPAGERLTRPRVLVLRTAGTNCDEETAHAFRLAGAEVESLYAGLFLRREHRLDEFDILALPGGFSYGDDLGAGTVLANQLRTRLADDLEAFAGSGRLVIGICNGFQVLVRLGLLPGWGGEKQASLIENVSGRFEARWVRLRVESRTSPFLAAAGEGTLRLPVAHREGRFVLRAPELVERLRESGQIALTYCRGEGGAAETAGGEYPANPNGSAADIAGISNPRGNVLGLMPHPERFVSLISDPLWTRRRAALTAGAGRALPPLEALGRGGDGFRFFENAVRFSAWFKTG
jgi:phosphoribosylformylglycinamidine synthase I